MISVIIPIYNCELLLERCLNSIFEQIIDVDVQIIAVDDGSTDKSVEIVKEYPSIILLEQSNQGPAAARNKGIDAATGKYLAFLDADDYWTSGFLSSTYEFMQIHPEAIAVSVGQLHKIPGKPDTIAPAFLNEVPMRNSEALILLDFFNFWALHNHVITGSVLLRTDIVKETGGQRPELRITEDLEFWAYMSTFGTWGFIPKVLHVSDGGRVVKKNGYIKKNRKRWSSAPSIEVWESRIISRLENDMLPSFSIARGRIVKNLIYAYLQSFRLGLAHDTVKKHNKYFPKSSGAKLYNICCRIGFPAWFIISILLIIREYVKSIKYLF